MTFYKVDYEKFTIDVRYNGISSSKRGFSALCRNGSCYQDIDAVTPKATTYWVCPAGSAANAAGGFCQATTITGCDECNYNGSRCIKCSPAYAVNGSGMCVICNITTQRNIGGVCYLKIANCSNYSTSDPTYCTKCQSGTYMNVSANECTPCNLAGQALVGDKCYPAIPNCLVYNIASPGKCVECASGYAFDLLNKQCTTCPYPDNVVYQLQCFTRISHCQTYSADTPAQCLLCDPAYAGPDCAYCSNGYLEYAAGLCTKSISGCLEYNSGGCTRCGSNRSPPACNCSDGYTNVKGVCRACVVNCDGCKSGGCILCSNGKSCPTIIWGMRAAVLALTVMLILLFNM